MPVFRASGAALALAAAAGWLAFAYGGGGSRPALAQADRPISLTPRATTPPATPPAAATPAPQAAPAATPADAPGSAVPTAVEVDRLVAVDPESVGTLEAAQGGFDVGMWGDSDRAAVARLLSALPGRVESAVLRNLARRLLLSRASAPRGPAGKPSLLAMRVDRLLALGYARDAVALTRVAPAPLADQAMARAEIDGLFLDNDNAGACTLARRAVRDYRDAFWQRALAFCFALEGEHDKAALIADLLRERDADTDPRFFVLTEALGGAADAAIDSLAGAEPLDLAMMRAARIALPSDVVVTDSPAILRRVALSPNAALDLRLEAAERAEAVGALSRDELSGIYGGVPFTPPELANPLSAAEANWGPRGRALVVRAAGREAVATNKAEILQRAWRLGREKGGLAPTLRASIPTLLTIAPDEALLWFAEPAARALFAAGEVGRAAAWVALARARAPTSPDAEAALIALWPLATLAGEAGDAEAIAPAGTETAEARTGEGTEAAAAAAFAMSDEDVLDRWLAAETARDSDAARTRAAMLYTLLDALDTPVAPQRWLALVEPGARVAVELPGPALRFALREASIGERLGETVLLVLTGFGESGLAGAAPVVLHSAIRALRRVGLEDAARALALEAAVVAGI
jgi:hypothetical protein